MFASGLIGPKEDGLLKSTIQAPKINIQEHRHWTDITGLAELKKVVFEELVASHKVVLSEWIPTPRFRGDKFRGNDNYCIWRGRRGSET